MVAALTWRGFAGGGAKRAGRAAEPDPAEIEILVAQIAEYLLAQLASCDIARRIDHCSLAGAGAFDRRGAAVTRLGDDVARHLLLGMHEEVPGGEGAAMARAVEPRRVAID